MSRSAIAALVLIAMTAPSSAEIEIVSAKGIDLKPGTKLDDSSVLNVPAAGELRVLKQPGALQYTVNGPFTGTLQQWVERCSGWMSKFNSGCGAAGKGDQLPVGGTRGLQR